MDPNDAVSRAWDAAYPSDAAGHARDEEVSELGIVGTLTRRLGVSRSAVEQLARADGFDKPSLDWFYRRWPNFPVRLVACRVPYLANTSDGSWLTATNVLKLSVFAAFVKAAEAVDAELAAEWFGIVFRWPKVGIVLLHAVPPSMFHTLAPSVVITPTTKQPQARLIRIVPINGVPMCFTLEHVATFLDRIVGDSDPQTLWT